MISETRSQHRGWVSSGREATIKGGPLTHVFTGSLESFAVPSLTLLWALCRTTPVFGQPADTWVIIQSRGGVPMGARSTENACIYSANVFPEVREWSPVVVTTACLLVLFERGLFGRWSHAEPESCSGHPGCGLMRDPGLMFQTPALMWPSQTLVLPIKHLIGWGTPLATEDELVGLHGFSLRRFCRDSMEWLISWPGSPHHRVSIDVISPAHDLDDHAPQRGLAMPPAKPCSPGATPPVHSLPLVITRPPPSPSSAKPTLRIHLLKPRLQEALANRPP